MILDNLKDIWQEQSESKIQFTETDIYKMIHKKSASIVKWIFYIGLLEFSLLLLLTLFMDSSSLEEELQIEQFAKITNMINYVLIVPYFLYHFYKNYKSICANDSSKKLINDILKTRKTVSYYVTSQIILAGLSLFVVLYKLSSSNVFLETLPKDVNMTLLWVIFIGISLFVLLIIWLIYKVLYGILLSKLNTNYQELLKSED